MKKIRLSHPSDRVLITVVVLLIASLIAVLWFYGERINTLWQQNGNTPLNPHDKTMNTETKFYVQAAMKSLYDSQPATDITQQRVYFPEARIYVPYSDYARSVVYRFDNGSDNWPATGFFTSHSNVNAVANNFDDVPCIQRSVSIVVNSKEGGDGDFVKAIKLSDGRTLNIFKHDSAACGDARWREGSPDKVVSLLEQAKSY